MKRKFSYVSSIAYSILALSLVSCNNGGKQQSTNLKNENSNDKPLAPEKLHMITSKSLSGKLQSTDTNLDNLIIGFDNISIGTGIDPITGDIFNSSKPMKESSFFYYDGDGSADSMAKSSNYIRPLNLCNDFTLVASAKEFGKVTSYSTDSIFSGDVNLGINYGLAKIKAAGECYK